MIGPSRSHPTAANALSYLLYRHQISNQRSSNSHMSTLIMADKHRRNIMSLGAYANTPKIEANVAYRQAMEATRLLEVIARHDSRMLHWLGQRSAVLGPGRGIWPLPGMDPVLTREQQGHSLADYLPTVERTL
jgi:hypothetical protein